MSSKSMIFMATPVGLEPATQRTRTASPRLVFLQASLRCREPALTESCHGRAPNVEAAREGYRAL